MQTLSFQVGRVTEWVDEYEKCRESQSPDLSLIPMSVHSRFRIPQFFPLHKPTQRTKSPD